MLKDYEIHADTSHGDSPVETIVVRADGCVEIMRLPWPLLVLNFPAWVQSLVIEIQVAGAQADQRGDKRIADIGKLVGAELVNWLAAHTENGLTGYPELKIRSEVQPWTVGEAELGEYLDAITKKSTPTELTPLHLREIECVLRADQNHVYVVDRLVPVADFVGKSITVTAVPQSEIVEHVLTLLGELSRSG